MDSGSGDTKLSNIDIWLDSKILQAIQHFAGVLIMMGGEKNEKVEKRHEVKFCKPLS